VLGGILSFWIGAEAGERRGAKDLCREQEVKP
jgi:hypothetical protein